MVRGCFLLFLLAAGAAPAPAAWKKHDGFFPFYWDEKAGKVWLELSRFGTK